MIPLSRLRRMITAQQLAAGGPDEWTVLLARPLMHF